MTRIRTGVAAATTQSTNHYTITASPLTSCLTKCLFFMDAFGPFFANMFIAVSKMFCFMRKDRSQSSCMNSLSSYAHSGLSKLIFFLHTKPHTWYYSQELVFDSTVSVAGSGNRAYSDRHMEFQGVAGGSDVPAKIHLELARSRT